jgi:hypothetical protein
MARKTQKENRFINRLKTDFNIRTGKHDKISKIGLRQIISKIFEKSGVEYTVKFQGGYWHISPLIYIGVSYEEQYSIPARFIPNSHQDYLIGKRKEERKLIVKIYDTIRKVIIEANTRKVLIEKYKPNLSDDRD